MAAAAVRTPVARPRARPRAAVEAPRGDVGGRVPRPRLPAGGARQLPGVDRVVAAAGEGRRGRRGGRPDGRGRAAAGGRDGAPLPPRGRLAQRRRVRRGQAGLGQPALPEGDPSGPPGREPLRSCAGRRRDRGRERRGARLAAGGAAAGGGVGRPARSGGVSPRDHLPLRPVGGARRPGPGAGSGRARQVVRALAEELAAAPPLDATPSVRWRRACAPGPARRAARCSIRSGSP